MLKETPLNSQIEILENRLAQIRVEVGAEALNKAKQSAARTLSQRMNIPGFRKGKAPYSIVERYLGEGAILEEAIDQIGPELYSEVVRESGLEPYAPGQLENVENRDDGLVLVFRVPLVPVVTLGNYRDVRREFTPPEVSDEDVAGVLRMMQNSQAEVEAKEGPAAMGDEVRLEVHGVLVPREGDEANAEIADLAKKPLFEHMSWRMVLGDPEREPVPGFSQALEGIAAEETRSFELSFPDDDEDYEENLRGRAVAFTVKCHAVNIRKLPALDDEFARSLGEEGAETLDALREKIREDLLAEVTARAKAGYANAVLGMMVEQAKIEYPEIMVDEYVDGMLHDLEHELASQGLDLPTFLNIRQITEEELRQEYREPAVARLKYALVLRELVEQEGLEVDSRIVDQMVRTRAATLSRGNVEMQQVFEAYLGQEQSRRDLSVELLTQHALDRIMAIARGENPETGPVPFVEESPAATAEESGPEPEAGEADLEAKPVEIAPDAE